MASRDNRLKQTARDMVLSMAVLVVPLVLAVAFFPHDSPRKRDQVATVDYSAALTSARHAAPFAVLAPAGLPGGWRASAVHYDSVIFGPTGTSYVAGGVPGAPLRWDLSFQSPDQQYVALDQITAGPEKILEFQAPGAEPVAGAAGKVTVGGYSWQKYESGERRALVRTVAVTGAGTATAAGSGAAAPSQVSIVVSGSATFEELAQFAATLKA